MSCDSVHDWWRDGRVRPAPKDVQAHLENCADCRAENASFDEEFAWFGEEEKALSNAAKMRAEILASKEKKAAPRIVMRSAQLALAAAFVFALFSWLIPSAEKTTITALSETTTFEKVGGGARLYEGLAHFSVELTDDQPNYTVNVGESRVQVIGTQFTVQAENEKLIRVDVYEGVVLVIHNEKSHKVLAGGHFEPKAKPPNADLEGIKNEPPEEATGKTKVIAKLPKAAKPVRLSDKKPVAKSPREMTNTQSAGAPKSAAFARAWRLIQAKEYERALSAMNEVDEAALGQLSPTLGYWRVLALKELGRIEEARKANAALQTRYPKSNSAKAAAQILSEKRR